MRPIASLNVTVGLLVCLLAPAWSARAAGALQGHDALEQCSSHSQSGMRECLAIKVKESEVQLKQAENSMSAALSRWDEDSKYVLVAGRRHLAASRAFTQYRQSQCALAAALAGGAAGNAVEMKRLACEFELNTQRAEYLRSTAEALPRR